MFFLRPIAGALLATAVSFLIDRTFNKRKTVDEYIKFFFLMLIAFNAIKIYENYTSMPKL